MAKIKRPKKILCMRPHRGWSLGLMPRTETPPPISEGRTWKASRWEHLSRSQQSRGQSRARLRARENEKSVLAIKLGPKAGCWRKAPDFLSPLPVFARCRGSFLADWILENVPFCPQKSPMALKTKDSKKRKFLRFMKGTSQRRLTVDRPELLTPLPLSFLREGLGIASVSKR